MRIDLHKHLTRFAQNKDIAKKLRETKIDPALKKGEKVVLDFTNIDGATQSCLHALFSPILKNRKQKALQNIEFKNVQSPATRQNILTVVRYSIG